MPCKRPSEPIAPLTFGQPLDRDPAGAETGSGGNKRTRRRSGSQLSSIGNAFVRLSRACGLIILQACSPYPHAATAPIIHARQLTKVFSLRDPGARVLTDADGPFVDNQLDPPADRELNRTSKRSLFRQRRSGATRPPCILNHRTQPIVDSKARPPAPCRERTCETCRILPLLPRADPGLSLTVHDRRRRVPEHAKRFCAVVWVLGAVRYQIGETLREPPGLHDDEPVVGAVARDVPFSRVRAADRRFHRCL